MRTKVAALAVALAVAVLPLQGAVAHAEPVPPNCLTQPWWRGEIMRMTTRIICDQPIRPDGSWLRGRVFVAAAYTTNAYSSCYRYGCTYYPSRYIPAYNSGTEFYDVNPGTVLGDEPGHLPA